MNLNSCVKSRLLQIHSCLLQNLVLKATYLHYSMVMEQIVIPLVDPSQNLIFAPLLTIELETLAPSWTISHALAHLTSTPTWEKWVVSNQIKNIWISLFVSNFVIVTSWTILLLVEDQYCLSLQYPLASYASSAESLSPHHHQTKTSKLLFWLS